MFKLDSPQQKMYLMDWIQHGPVENILLPIYNTNILENSFFFQKSIMDGIELELKHIVLLKR